MMKGNRTRKKRAAGYTRVTLAMMLTALMVVSSLSPVCSSFAEVGAGNDGPAKVTEAEKKEAPKPDASDQGSEPKATAPENSGGKGGSSEGDRAGSEGGEDPKVKETEPADPAKQAEDRKDGNKEDEDRQDGNKDDEDEDGDEKMPAQSFSGSAGGVSVRASAGEGVFPEGTKMKVSSVKSSYVISAANRSLGADSEIVDAAAVDITFFSKGKEIQPADGSVSVSLSSRVIAGDEHEAVHVSGGSASIICGASAGHASFRADHFSIYGIIGVNYENPDVEKYARYTYIFKVNDQEVDRQIVRNGETVAAPKDPANKWFKGWEIDGKITEFPLTAVIPEDETEDRDITVKAAFEDVCTATFYKYENSTDSILQVMEEKKGTTVSTTGVSFVYEDGRAIIGWKEKGTGKALNQITLDRDYELVPIISQTPVQVTFVTGEGTPITPVFVDKGQVVNEPADPSRSGYTFTGWFSDEACKDGYNFNTPVNGDLTLYAGWNGERTAYSVLYWKQNANDDGYVYMEQENRTGNAGTAATYSTRNYPGFTLNATKSDNVEFIKGDGTTIKNVYYDRNVYPLSFKIYKGLRWVDAGTKNFKYEQDTSEYWNQITAQNEEYKWYVSQSFSDTVFYTYAPPMKPANGNMTGFNGITAYGRTDSGSYTIRYVEDGTNTKIHTDFTGAGGASAFTDEDHIIIPGFAFSREGAFSNGKGTLYYKRNTYSMEFVTNGGPAVASARGIPYEASLNGYAPTAYKAGVTTKTVNGITYTFDGWYDNEAYASDPFNFNSRMPALEAVNQSGDKATLVLYAKWVREEHTVSFDLAGGSYDGGNSIPAQAVESGNQATAPDSGKLEKDGYLFGYWIDENGDRFSFDTRIKRDIELKAVWHTDRTRILTVQYDANGGEGSFGDDNLYQDGAHAIVCGQPLAPKGKYFVGWKIGSSDVTVAGGAFQVKLEDADADRVVTLTAQFADKPVHPATVVYNANGGKFDDDKTTKEDANAVVNGDYTVADYAPTRDGHTFKGWALTSGATAAVLNSGDKVVAGKSGNVLYAVYEQDASLTAVNVIITGNSETKTYTGSEQEVTGFTYKVYESGTSTELPGAAQVTLAQGKAARASGTDADEYPMGLTEDHFNISPSTGYTIDNVQVNDGKLVISAADLSLTATGYEGTYDGAQHGGDISVNAAGATIHYSRDNTNWSYEPPLIKDAGEFTVYVKATKPNYNTATAEYTLKVTPASLTITTGSASKPYDGTPLTKDEATIEGLAAGETATVRATGSQTDIGRSVNTYSIDWGTAKAANYTPVENLGVLEVTSPGPPAPPEVTVIITGKTDSLTYDGQEHSVSGYDVEIVGSDEYTEDDFTFSGTAEVKGTDAAVYPMGLAEDQFANINGNFTNVNFLVRDGQLAITPLTVTVKITGYTKIVSYNGMEQIVSGCDTVIDNALYTEADFTFTGKAEARGTEQGLYPMGLTPQQFVNTNSNFEAIFIVEDGCLEITGMKIQGDEDKEKEDTPEKKDGEGNDSGGKNKNNGSGSSDVSGGGTRTGDSSPLILGIILMLAAIAAAGGIVVRRRIRSR